MSGPKSYSPPPRYSVSVFNGQLNQVFESQARIQSLLSELSALACSDSQRNIQFDCSDFLASIKDVSQNLLKPFSIQHKGSFGQAQYNEYSRQISAQLDALRTFLPQVQDAKNDFLSKREDYTSYVAYDNFYNRSRKSFEAFKAQVINTMEKYVKPEHPELFRVSVDEIDRIQMKAQKVSFAFGFTEIQPQRKSTVQEDIQKCEDQIQSIRNRLSSEILDRIPSNDSLTESKDDDIADSLRKIRSLIHSIEDSPRRSKYESKLQSILDSQTLRDEFYITELHEDIRQSEQTLRMKEMMRGMIHSINAMQFHKDLNRDKMQLLQELFNLAERERMKRFEFEQVQSRLSTLEKQNEKLLQEECIKEKERQFLKDQIVKGLQNLNYEVIDDMKVIDFEKRDDLLFTVPEQNNFLNLRFQKDGSFHYTFYIPESKDALDQELTHKRVDEMKTTCQQFKDLLKNLASLGLRIDLKSEKPADELALLKVPEQYQGMLEKILKERQQLVEEEKKKSQYHQ